MANYGAQCVFSAKVGAYRHMPSIRSVFEQTQQLWCLSTPLVLAKVNIPLRGLAMTWIFAQLGEEVLHAGALVFALFFTVVTFLLGTLMSSVGVTMAYAIGADDKPEVTRIFQSGLLLGMLLSLPAMLMFYYAPTFFLLLGQNEALVSQAESLTRVFIWVILPYTWTVNFHKLFINLKKSPVSFMYSLLGLGFTVIASYCLAFGKMGLPALGMAGVGWGMVLAYWLQTLAFVLHSKLSKITQQYNLFYFTRFDYRPYLKKLWVIGWPVGLKYNMQFFLFFIIALIIGRLEHQSLAVYQVVLQLFMIASSLASGVGLGAEALIGQAIGGKQKITIRSACYASVLLALSYVAMVAAICLCFPTWIASFFFIQDSHNFTLLLQVLSAVMLFQLLDGIRQIVADVLVTFKDSTFPLLAELVGFWMVSLPLSYLFAIFAQPVLHSFLYGLIFGMLICITIVLLRFRRKLVAIVESI